MGRVWKFKTFSPNVTVFWASINIAMLHRSQCFQDLNARLKIGKSKFVMCTGSPTPAITDDRSEELRHSNLDCGNLRPIPLPLPCPPNRSLPEQIPPLPLQNVSNRSAYQANPPMGLESNSVNRRCSFCTAWLPPRACCFAFCSSPWLPHPIPSLDVPLKICNVFCFHLFCSPLLRIPLNLPLTVTLAVAPQAKATWAVNNIYRGDTWLGHNGVNDFESRHK